MPYSLGKPNQTPYVSAMSNWGSMPQTDFSLTQSPDLMQQLNQGVGLRAPGNLWQSGALGGGLPGAGGESPGWMESFGDNLKKWGVVGSTDKFGNKTDGFGSLALGTVSGIMNAYMGMKQYGLAKDMLAHNKDQFNKNYAAQKTTTNASLEDRQRARVASNPGAYVSVGDYMNKNGIK